MILRTQNVRLRTSHYLKKKKHLKSKYLNRTHFYYQIYHQFWGILEKTPEELFYMACSKEEIVK